MPANYRFSASNVRNTTHILDAGSDSPSDFGIGKPEPCKRFYPPGSGFKFLAANGGPSFATSGGRDGAVSARLTRRLEDRLKAAFWDAKLCRIDPDCDATSACVRPCLRKAIMAAFLSARSNSHLVYHPWRPACGARAASADAGPSPLAKTSSASSLPLAAIHDPVWRESPLAGGIARHHLNVYT